jgi:hypothetical protein
VVVVVDLNRQIDRGQQQQPQEIRAPFFSYAKQNPATRTSLLFGIPPNDIPSIAMPQTFIIPEAAHRSPSMMNDGQILLAIMVGITSCILLLPLLFPRLYSKLPLKSLFLPPPFESAFAHLTVHFEYQLKQAESTPQASSEVRESRSEWRPKQGESTFKSSFWMIGLLFSLPPTSYPAPISYAVPWYDAPISFPPKHSGLGNAPICFPPKPCSLVRFVRKEGVYFLPHQQQHDQLGNYSFSLPNGDCSLSPPNLSYFQKVAIDNHCNRLPLPVSICHRNRHHTVLHIVRTFLRTSSGNGLSRL